MFSAAFSIFLKLFRNLSKGGRFISLRCAAAPAVLDESLQLSYFGFQSGYLQLVRLFCQSLFPL